MSCINSIKLNFEIFIPEQKQQPFVFPSEWGIQNKPWWCQSYWIYLLKISKLQEKYFRIFFHAIVWNLPIWKWPDKGKAWINWVTYSMVFGLNCLCLNCLQVHVQAWIHFIMIINYVTNSKKQNDTKHR